MRQPIYIDMDDTIVNFKDEADALQRFNHERGFFYGLKPMPKNLQAVRDAIAHGENVYIITASPNEQADMDKLRWLSRHLGELQEGHALIVRLGSNKAHFMPTDNGILFDDYGKNCREWVGAKDGNRAVKVRNDGDIAIGLQAMKILKDSLLNA